MSGDYWTINSDYKLDAYIEHIRSLSREHGYLIIPKAKTGKQRTATQNNALHLMLAELAEQLNNAGLDMRIILAKQASIPWSQKSVKEKLWVPVQEAMTGKKSTTQCSRVEYSEIYEVLSRHMAKSFSFVCPPWPIKKDKDKDKDEEYEF